MNYTIDDLERDVAKREIKLSEIRRDRGKRYGSAEDTLANVAMFGWRGAIINVFECAMRLRNAFCARAPNIEDIRDASRDIANYGHYVEILLDREIEYGTTEFGVAYPCFCSRCHYPWIGKACREACPKCGEDDMVFTCERPESDAKV